MDQELQIWGLVSGIAYFIIVYEIWMGGPLRNLQPLLVVQFKLLIRPFVDSYLIGWAIYPIGLHGWNSWMV